MNKLERIANWLFGSSSTKVNRGTTQTSYGYGNKQSITQTNNIVSGDMTAGSIVTKTSKGMNTININGENISVSGNNIRVENDKVYVDNVMIKSGMSGIVKIEFKGDLAKLDCNTCVIHGSVAGDVDANTVTCGDVGGDVDANTVKCLTINGDVDANTVSGGIKM